MRFWTIWTMPLRAMSMKERFRRTGDWADLTIAHRLPKRVRYWVVMTAIGRITSRPPYNTEHPMGLTVEQVLKEMDKTEMAPRS